MRDVDELMEVQVEDVPAGSQAAVLGAPLNAASQLYSYSTTKCLHVVCMYTYHIECYFIL